MAGKVALTIAQASAAGTTAGAPTPMSVGPQQNTAVGSNQPQQGAPAGAPQPPQPPQGRPSVAPHAGVQSVGTHPSASPFKRANPVHPFGK
jgi:hypothetical protein